MSMTSLIISRGITTSCSQYGKRNFRKFELINKRGTRLFKKMQAENPDPRYPIDRRGVKVTGYYVGKTFVEVPEMIPEIIVPDLKDFNLKAYVTYRCENVNQSEFTAKDLFDAVYAEKIQKDFVKGKLGPLGEPLDPSPEEKLTPTEARQLASKPGSDIFTADPLPIEAFVPPIRR